ncbi:MAG: MazG nucleotide pyrophosphohydrolase domain-containing protein [Armatimonadota bacterium]|nr:nucleotide pyrophosphohydrolase [Armatimonadota bacterium]MCX7777349.1 nucleotide pyrophosphohydrolase [Armatimonadota bacterium]MDW8025383.1 MazG nucleotide pyrophosphohydrolase domain-containing protein [Armatimonadota bacterium]
MQKDKEELSIGRFQRLIANAYVTRDKERGIERTFLWFVEEVGELARAIKRGGQSELEEEFSDVLAWLVSLATLLNVDMEKAARRYLNGCPKCKSSPCTCPMQR